VVAAKDGFILVDTVDRLAVGQKRGKLVADRTARLAGLALEHAVSLAAHGVVGTALVAVGTHQPGVQRGQAAVAHKEGFEQLENGSVYNKFKYDAFGVIFLNNRPEYLM